MYPHKYIIPKNSNIMYRNLGTYSQDDRFFLTPFLFGGLAGTALGYGIANNNQLNNNNNCCGQFYPMPMMMPIYQVPYNHPTFSTQPNYSVQATNPNNFSNFGNNNFY